MISLVKNFPNFMESEGSISVQNRPLLDSFWGTLFESLETDLYMPFPSHTESCVSEISVSLWLFCLQFCMNIEGPLNVCLYLIPLISVIVLRTLGESPKLWSSPLRTHPFSYHSLFFWIYILSLEICSQTTVVCVLLPFRTRHSELIT